jgi:SAM-dependent methyltransferase
MATLPDPEDDSWDWGATPESQRQIDDAQVTPALFCRGETCATPALAAARTKAATGFDLEAMCAGLTAYERIRLVNCARQMEANDGDDNEECIGILAARFAKPGGESLDDDSLLKPVLESDPLLQYAVALGGGDDDDWSDDELERESGSTAASSAPVAPFSPATSVAALAGASSPSQEIAALRKQLLRAKELLHEYGVADDLPEGFEGPDNDSYYFDSYSHWGIHQEMLKDAVRTDAYRDAIERNADFFKGKSVLDVGCGTGILSMFAARAGAKRVVGVDMSSMAFKAMENVKENGLEDVVTIIHGKIEDLGERWASGDGNNAGGNSGESKEVATAASATVSTSTKAREALQPGSFDIILSEWMGYALVFECMMETVLKARDVWLRKDGKGLVLPNTAEIYVQAMADQRDWDDMVGYWGDVYGFKMNGMRKLLLPEAQVQIVRPESILGGRCLVREFDCQTVKPEHLDVVDAPFELDLTGKLQGTATEGLDLDDVVPQDAITAICISFDCHFRHSLLAHAAPLPTGPECTPTHWKQTVLYLPTPVARKSLLDSNKLTGKISIGRNAQNPRNLDFALTLKTKGEDVTLAFKMG